MTPEPGARPPRPVRDPGLQPERTALAWQRTSLSTAMVALLLAFACLRGGFLIGAVAAALITLAAVVVLYGLRRRAVARERADEAARAAVATGRAGTEWADAGGTRPATSPWGALTRVTAVIVATAVLGGILGAIILF